MKLRLFFTQNQNSRSFVKLLITTVLCTALFIIQSQIKIKDFSSKPSQNKVFSSQFFKFSTIGYWPAAVDWMWIETLQRSGEENYAPELIPSTQAFYEMATDLDPRFYELYEQAGVVFSFFFHSSDLSIHFLEKGVHFYERNLSSGGTKSWSHPFTLHLLLAYQYSYEKNDWSKGREYFLRAAEIPGAPPYLQKMRIWLSEEGSDRLLAKKVLTLLMNNANDPIQKSQYKEKLKAYD